MTDWYPVMLKISGKTCVVAGGGAVAARKTAGLLDAGAQVKLVSPRVTDQIRQWAEAGLVDWRRREVDEADVAGAVLVFAATDRPEVNRTVAEAAQRLGIPVNVADDGESGDLLLPAVLRRGRFVVTAAASGAGPALAARVVREMAERYGPEYAEYTQMLAQIRSVVKSLVADAQERRRLLTAAAEPDALEEWRSDGALGWDPQQWLERLRLRAASAVPEEE